MSGVFPVFSDNKKSASAHYPLIYDYDHYLSCFSPWLTAFSWSLLWELNLSHFIRTKTSLQIVLSLDFACDIIPTILLWNVCPTANKHYTVFVIQYEFINRGLNCSVINCFIFLIPSFVMFFFFLNYTSVCLRKYGNWGIVINSLLVHIYSPCDLPPSSEGDIVNTIAFL